MLRAINLSPVSAKLLIELSNLTFSGSRFVLNTYSASYAINAIGPSVGRNLVTFGEERMRAKLLVLFSAVLMVSCASQYPNREVVGENFPEIKGQSLDKQAIVMPDHFIDRKVLLLLGYKQEAQFDIDRWLIGLDMTKTRIEVFELPTIAGMFPRFFKTQIDNGMRAGIPKELWQGVITVYSDGDTVQQFTGNINPNNARVLLLDERGKVVYFYDRGFSVNALNEVRNMVIE